MNFECNRCYRNYESEEKYNKHVKLGRCKEPYECKNCDYVTNRKSSYDKHLNTKKCKMNTSKISSKNFECEICGLTFRDNCDLQRHVNKKTPCIPRDNTAINNGTINNTTNNTNNTNITNTTNNTLNYNQQYNVILSECQMNPNEKLSKVNEHLINGFIYSPNISDERYMSVFKENKLPKLIKNYSPSNPEHQRDDNTLMATHFIDGTIPQNPQLSDIIPIFMHEKSKNILVKDNNEIVRLNSKVLQNLLEKIKGLSIEFQERLKDSTNEVREEYILNNITEKLQIMKKTLQTLLFKIDNPFSCENCICCFKTPNLLQKHIQITHS